MKATIWILGALVIAFLLILFIAGSPNSEDLNQPTEKNEGSIPNTSTEEKPQENTPPPEVLVDEGIVVNKVKEISFSGTELPSIDELKLVSIDAVDWPNACLGVETEDELCAQVITPGYKVTLQADGAQLVYHTDITGNSIRFFESISLEE